MKKVLISLCHLTTQLALVALLATGACKSTQNQTGETRPEQTAPNQVAEGCIDESKVNPDRPCIKIYQPVCGCNGQTYGNTCEAENAGLNFVDRWRV